MREECQTQIEIVIRTEACFKSLLDSLLQKNTLGSGELFCAMVLPTVERVNLLMRSRKSLMPLSTGLLPPSLPSQ